MVLLLFMIFLVIKVCFSFLFFFNSLFMKLLMIGMEYLREEFLMLWLIMCGLVFLNSEIISIVVGVEIKVFIKEIYIVCYENCNGLIFIRVGFLYLFFGWKYIVFLIIVNIIKSSK